MMRKSILVLLSAVVVVFVALAGIALAGMGQDDAAVTGSDDSMTTTTTMGDDSDSDDYGDDSDSDDYGDDSDSDDDSDGYGNDSDSDSDDDSDDYGDDSGDGSMQAIEDQTSTYEVPCVGTVTVEVMDGKLMLSEVDSPGWEYMVDGDRNKVKVEFYGPYDSKSTIEIVLDHDQFEVKIQNDSDDCHDVTADRAETFNIAGVGSVSVEVMDGKLTLSEVDAPGWEYMVDSDWNKVKIEFYMGEDKATIEIVLDDYEFKVKIDTDFK